MFTDSDLKRADLLDENLKLKHQGGINQQSGGRYEDYFALSRIVQYVSKNQSEISLCSQVKNCFIDDLVVREQRKDFFYQLKNTKKLSWNKNLFEDFDNQYRLCTVATEKFLLSLVLGNKKIYNKMCRDSKYKKVKKTKVIFFHMPQDMGDFVANSAFPDFQKSLKKISAKEDPSLQDMESLAKRILSEWIDLSTPNKFIKIGKIKEKVIRNQSTPIKKDWPLMKGWKKAESILNKIKYLKFTIKKGIFEYSFGQIDKGLLDPSAQPKQFQEFIENVIKMKPKTIDDLEGLF